MLHALFELQASAMRNDVMVLTANLILDATSLAKLCCTHSHVTTTKTVYMTVPGIAWAPVVCAKLVFNDFFCLVAAILSASLGLQAAALPVKSGQ